MNQQAYDNMEPPEYYDDFIEERAIEEAADNYFSLCVNHNVTPSIDLSFEGYNLNDPFGDYEPETAAKAEFIRLHEEKANQLGWIVKKDFTMDDLPENEREVFELIFDPSNQLEDYKVLIEEGIFDV